MSNIIHKVFSRAMSQFGSISYKQFLFLTLIGVFLIVLIVLFKVLVLKQEINLRDIFAWLSFVVYVSIILQLTLLGRKSGSRIGIELSINKGQWNSNSDFAYLLRAYSLLNVLLFVPYGFILMIFTRLSKFHTIVRIILGSFISFLSSLLIECVQLLTQRGFFELDDLLCNTIGGFCGCILGVFIIRLISIGVSRYKEKNKLPS